MALTNIVLKDNVFLTIDDVKDWLKIPPGASDKDPNIDNRIARFMNQVTDMAERYIQGPIKTRAYTEYRDGDSSNTIVPQFYPIREVGEIRVDFNRQFSDATIVTPGQYIIRGPADSSFPNKIRGTDIVLRDDNDTSIVGRIFTGSTAGSIRISYTAGWGVDQTEIPSDLATAVLLGIEFFYMLRETRDLSTQMKIVGDQRIVRIKGLPKEVTDILDTYVDHTLGYDNRPQLNTFTL